MVVIGVISVMLVMLVPALTSLNGAGSITNAAFTIKGLLEQARSHAAINNTYVWVGFFEEDSSQPSTTPATAGIGRIVMCTVASKDGTIAYKQPVESPAVVIDTAKLIQVGNLVRIDRVHLRTFPNGTGGGTDTFSARPPIPGGFTENAKIGDTSPPDSLRPFQYPVRTGTPAQYRFVKLIEFSPRGESRVNNNNFTIRTLLEVGIQPVRGAAFDEDNRCAIQVSGFAGNVKVYQP